MFSRIGLGTAQFGSSYGITNLRGKVPEVDVREILRLAAGAGVRTIDTASQYGRAEAVLGRTFATRNELFRIVTKTPVIRDRQVSQEHVHEVGEVFHQSLALMRRASIYGLLVHHSPNITGPGSDRLLRLLQSLKERGLVAKIGVSVYSGGEIDQILSRFNPDIVQVPINLVDERLVRSEHLKLLKSKGVEIHARSIFLQGMLLKDPTSLPSYFRPIQRSFVALREAMLAQNLGPLEACLNYVLERPELDVILIGVASVSEFREIISAIQRVANGTYDPLELPMLDEQYLNPALWP